MHNEILSASYDLNLDEEKYLNKIKDSDYRVTLINAQGKVVFDNEANPEHMANHLTRQEIKETIEKGAGSSVRYSDTLNEKQYYEAIRLDSGNILRLSITCKTLWAFLISLHEEIFFLFITIIILSILISFSLSNQIIKPINSIDLNNPSQYYDKNDYQEIEPLLKRLFFQQKEIKTQQIEIEKNALMRQKICEVRW